MLIPKEKPIRDKAHLKFISSLPCITCDAPPPVDPSHISRGNGKAMGRKVGDNFTVPQCRKCHSEVHNIGEITWWYKYGGYETATVLAKKLYKNTGDIIKCEEEIRKWKRR